MRHLLYWLLVILVGGSAINAYSELQPKTLIVGANTVSNPTRVGLIVVNNKVGINTLNPLSLLSVAAVTGSALDGSALSTIFRTHAGTLGTTSGNEISLGSIGFTSSNHVYLGVRLVRTSAGSDWQSSALELGMDVDNTVRAGACLYLAPNGYIGIGTNKPSAPLEVVGTLKSTQWNVTEVMQMQNQVGIGTTTQTVLSTNTFTTGGGTLEVMLSASGYRTSAGFIVMTAYVMDSATSGTTSLGTLTVYTNETSSHKAIVPVTFIKTGIPASTYKIKIISDSATYLNTDDYVNCTVTEWPF